MDWQGVERLRLERAFVGHIALTRTPARTLDTPSGDRYRECMAQSIFVFDFGANEEAAQRARHKVDGWRQGFRLGNKILLKFERAESAGDTGDTASMTAKEGARSKSAAKKQTSKQDEADKEKALANIRLFVRLDFSDHEKLSHQRWLDRIPTEEPFKSAKVTTVRTGDPEFPKVAELFDSLD